MLGYIAPRLLFPFVATSADWDCTSIGSGQAAFRKSHGDRIVGVAEDVPARILAGVGEQRARTGDVFFGVYGVDLKFSFVAVVGNREDADAMNGRRGGAELGNGGAEMEPGEVDGIGDKEKRGEGGRDAG